jgi:hypothetical protein
MRSAIHLAAVLLLATLAAPSLAAATDTAREVAHLLDYIEASGCTFVRNGSASDATTARRHVERKYDYVKSRVQSAEDFVRLAATRSSVSGEPYQVRRGGEERLTGAWLAQELARYRDGAARAHTKAP